MAGLSSELDLKASSTPKNIRVQRRGREEERKEGREGGGDQGTEEERKGGKGRGRKGGREGERKGGRERGREGERGRGRERGSMGEKQHLSYEEITQACIQCTLHNASIIRQQGKI